MNFFFFPQYNQFQIDSFSVCPDIDRCLDQLKHAGNENLAVGGSRQRILNSRSYSPLKIFCFDRYESIASYQPALLMRKDFVLRQRIDELIQNAFEGGLFVKWDRDSQRKKEHIFRYEAPLEITMEEFYVAYFIFGSGLAVSFLSFTLEHLIQWRFRHTQKPRLPAWTFYQTVVDGRRNFFTNLPERLMETRWRVKLPPLKRKIIVKSRIFGVKRLIKSFLYRTILMIKQKICGIKLWTCLNNFRKKARSKLNECL